MTSTAVIYGEHLQRYNTSDDAERPVRRRLAMGLLAAYGLLNNPDVDVVNPAVATLDEIVRVHAPAYVNAVRRYSDDPMRGLEWEAQNWGFVAGSDTVIREGMHEAAAAVCGASLTGARLIMGGAANRAFCPAPAGLHHALANRANGFCVYNDCAVAIRELLDQGAERVAYVDLDAHHGDGVQWIFYGDPRVLTVSVHEKTYGFFPGTGGVDERGVDAGLGTSLNVPLPPFAGDVAMLAAMEDVVIPAVTKFRPDVLVTHLGVDIHHADPMAHLQATLPGMERLYRLLDELARTATPRGWLNLTGGGYNVETLGRFWALQLATMANIDLANDLPIAWIGAATDVIGHAPSGTLRVETEPSHPAEERAAADSAGVALGRRAALIADAEI